MMNSEIADIIEMDQAIKEIINQYRLKIDPTTISGILASNIRLTQDIIISLIP